jgi:hypothetical protein
MSGLPLVGSDPESSPNATVVLRTSEGVTQVTNRPQHDADHVAVRAILEDWDFDAEEQVSILWDTLILHLGAFHGRTVAMSSGWSNSCTRHEEYESAFPSEYPPVSEVSPLRSGTPGLRPDSVPIRFHVGSSSDAQAHPAPLVGRCDRSSC